MSTDRARELYDLDAVEASLMHRPLAEVARRALDDERPTARPPAPEAA